jgi:hypothetical protein
MATSQESKTLGHFLREVFRGEQPEKFRALQKVDLLLQEEAIFFLAHRIEVLFREAEAILANTEENGKSKTKGG